VISANKAIEIETDPRLEQQVFSCDGFLEQFLPPDTKIQVQRSKRVVKLIRMRGNYFYHTLREKLNWGMNGPNPRN
jgi:NAD kinase